MALTDAFTGESIKSTKECITVTIGGKKYHFKTKDNLRLWMAQRRMLTGFPPPVFGPSLPIPEEIHRKTLEKFGRDPDEEKVFVNYYGRSVTFRNMSELKAWVTQEVGEGKFA